jgi:hypothetical protein
MNYIKSISQIGMRISLFVIVFNVIGLFLNPVTCFSQCPSSTNILSQNFNAGTGTFNSGATGTAAGTESKGAYAASFSSKVTVTNNVDACCAAGPDDWRKNLTVDPSVLPTGNNGGTSSDYAMLVDGSMTNGSFWCATVTVAPGEIYDFSAFYTSPWLQDKAGDPGLYFTINGVQLGSMAIVDQYNPTTSAPQPYIQQECYYTIPAGTSGSVQFCLNLMESMSCSGIPTTTVGGSCVYPATTQQSQGNDILVDDISIKKCNSGGTTSGCTYAGTTVTPVELLSFTGRKVADHASLTWVTALEKNSSYFSIEKSENSINFFEIGTVNAKGTSNEIVNYVYDDNQFDKSSYYRLRMVDNDGSYKYSSVQFLETGNNYARIIRTESGGMEVMASVNEDTRWNIAVYSLLGQEYANQNVQLTKGDNTLLKGVSWGEKSAKILRITSLDGSEILSQVIIW